MIKELFANNNKLPKAHIALFKNIQESDIINYLMSSGKVSAPGVNELMSKKKNKNKNKNKGDKEADLGESEEKRGKVVNEIKFDKDLNLFEESKK